MSGGKNPKLDKGHSDKTVPISIIMGRLPFLGNLNGYDRVKVCYKQAESDRGKLSPKIFNCKKLELGKTVLYKKFYKKEIEGRH